MAMLNNQRVIAIMVSGKSTRKGEELDDGES
jgi:hypothetical protein